MNLKNILLLFALASFSSLVSCPQPSYCNRPCWDPNGTHPAQSNPTSTSVTHIIVHHTGDGVVLPTNTNYAARVRFYWDLHVNTNGWSDIGYNWLIDRNGIIYEGRGDGILGAHFSGMNSGTMGVALIGDFTLETPSTAAVNALKDLLAWEAVDKNIDVTASSYHAASQLVLNNISGHMDGSATACPGTDLYSLLPSIRSDVSNYPCYGGGSPNSLDCSNAIPLTCGQTYSGGSSSANSNVSTYGCNNWTETGPERVHTVTLSANGTITASLSNFSGDLDVYILGSCDPSNCLGSVGSSSASYSGGQAGQTYYIVVDSDDGSGGSYDLTLNCPIGANDIFMSNEAITSSTNVSPGGTIDVEVQQNYSGASTNIPNVYVDYVLSTDCNLDASDIVLDNDFSTIDANDPEDAESETLTIPSNTLPGSYYILFVGDATDVVAESNEGNNIVCVPITVQNITTSEDIFLTNASITSSTTVNAGGTVDVSVDQNYSGSSTNVPSIDLHYLLSTDCFLDGSDIYLNDDLSTIDANDPVDPENESLTIPSGTPSGIYYILFVADALDAVAESDETNNVTCEQIIVTTTTVEDIYISNASITSSLTVAPGEDLSVELTQNYSGSSTSPIDVYVHYYISEDCNLNILDVLLFDNEFSSLSSTNIQESESEILTLPNLIPEGNYNLLIWADATDAVIEGDETNNFVCLPFEIQNSNTTGLEEIAPVSPVIIYPNPSHGIVIIQSSKDNLIHEINVQDLNGRILYKTEVNDTEGLLNLSKLPVGMYVITAVLNDGSHHDFKWLKE